MNRVKLIVALSFVLAFAAGVSVGLVIKPSVRKPQGGLWLSHELDLTREQEKLIEEIWSDVVHRGRRRHAKRRLAIEKERNERIRALLSEDQRGEYEAIAAELEQEREGFRLEGKAQIDKAVEATKNLLTEQQCVKYEKLLEEKRKTLGSVSGPPPGWRRAADDAAHTPPDG